MKEITILSGKGGTGKTSFTAALATIAENSVFCDNDVNASDLHLIFQPTIREKNRFSGSRVAHIDNSKCISCRDCFNNCRFNAIQRNCEGELEINPFRCEGCRLCERMCKMNAITTTQNNNNYWYVSTSRFGSFIHAKMSPGEEHSGKLITQVRRRAKEIAQKNKAQFIIMDGPPGIGCATISSLVGSDIALIILEPTKSGWHDAQRLIELIKTFKIQVFAIINKFNINSDLSREISGYLKAEGVILLAKVPFDKEVIKAMVDGQTIIEYNPHSRVSRKISELWQTISTWQN